MRALLAGILPLAANVALFCVILWYGERDEVIDYSEVLAVLSASAIVLTGTAIIIAILSWYGYREIRERSEEVARRSTRVIARKEAARTAAQEAQRIAPSEARRAAYDWLKAFGVSGTEQGESSGDDIAALSDDDQS